MSAFLDNWGEPTEPHASADCPTCGGSLFYKTPFGCDGVIVECEDEDNCECDCHRRSLLVAIAPGGVATRAALAASEKELTE